MVALAAPSAGKAEVYTFYGSFQGVGAAGDAPPRSVGTFKKIFFISFRFCMTSEG